MSDRLNNDGDQADIHNSGQGRLRKLPFYIVDFVRKTISGDSTTVTLPSGSVKFVLIGLRKYFLAAAAFSGCINILMLSGSLFMLQVYDRVLPSHSLETLEALVILIVILYIFTALLEVTRSRLFARIGRHFDLCLRDAVFDLNLNAAMPGNKHTDAVSPFKDLDQIRTFLAGGGPSAIFDLPWMPLYVILLFMLHPLLGCLGLVGIFSLAGLTWLTDRAMSPHQKIAYALTSESSALAYNVQAAAETVKPLGMTGALRALWSQKNRLSGESVILASDTSGAYGGVSRFMRMTLQSCVLALGAYLVMTGKATGGVMIASSILLGRALSPVELAIAHWRGFVSAREGYARLESSLQTRPSEPSVRLPAPKIGLSVENVYLNVPGITLPILNGVNFELSAGDALGIMGPSGSGKSTLVRALVGVWPILRGSIRLDGARLEQWTEQDAAKFIGYMPQGIDLFAGTIGQNISRFDAEARSEAILKSAAIAGVDTLVRRFDDGYGTHIGVRGERLSAGQRQRLALARALYGDPFLVVLDEPNSALDSEGEMALIDAIATVRQRGGIVIIVAHRPNVMQTVNKVLILGDGQQQIFGLRDEVFKQALRASSSQAGGVRS